MSNQERCQQYVNIGETLLKTVEYGFIEFTKRSPPVSEASTAPISIELTTIS